MPLVAVGWTMLKVSGIGLASVYGLKLVNVFLLQ